MSPFKAPIDARTRYCAVYGHPIRHSASPAMQNAGLAALGLNWRYLAFDVRPEQLREAVAGAQAMRFIGLNLTVPHKLLAVDILDELDESARQWGAVNTIRFMGKHSSGQWLPLRAFEEDLPDEIRSQGFNTDADAIAQVVREDLKLNPQGARMVVLGAGGAGRVAALKLAAEGAAELFLVNRTVSKAEQLAAEIRQRYPSVQVHVGYPEGEVDLVINATSLGLHPDDPLPLDVQKWPLTQAICAFDMIYRPAETPFLKAAKEADCRAVNGVSMLLYQGTRALEIWTGRTAPAEIMRSALEKELYG